MTKKRRSYRGNVFTHAKSIIQSLHCGNESVSEILFSEAKKSEYGSQYISVSYRICFSSDIKTLSMIFGKPFLGAAKRWLRISP